MAFLRTVLRFALIACFGLLGLALLIVFVPFVWQLVSSPDEKVALTAPNSGWVVEITEDCLSGNCNRYARLKVDTGWFSSTQLECRMERVDWSRTLFDSVQAVSWENSDTVVHWTAGSPPLSGTIDLANDCSNVAARHERTSLTTLRFRENCLLGACRREVDWVNDIGGQEYEITPCRLDAAGDELVFTNPNDYAGQVVITWDIADAIADWESQGTGQIGRIAFATDCDTSLTRREPRVSD